jgi:hypothetical protein
VDMADAGAVVVGVVAIVAKLGAVGVIKLAVG